jgi:hypothetical protein
MRKGDHPQAATGEDPDIAGIIPGPQPKPWNDEDLVPLEEEEQEAEGT